MLAAIGWPASELWDKALADTFGIDAALTSKLEAPSVLNGGLDRISPAFWGAALGFGSGHRIVRPQAALLEDRAEPLEPGNLQFDPLGMYPVERVRRKRMDEAEVKHGRSPCSPWYGYASPIWCRARRWPPTSGFFEPFWAHCLGGLVVQAPCFCMCLPPRVFLSALDWEWDGMSAHRDERERSTSRNRTTASPGRRGTRRATSSDLSVTVKTGGATRTMTAFGVSSDAAPRASAATTSRDRERATSTRGLNLKSTFLRMTPATVNFDR